ncbi:MAG: ATP-binding protein [Candidatus Omnitrophota bacterium]
MKPVSEYMTPVVVSVGLDRPVEEAVVLMRTKGIGSVLVMDAQNKPVGIFTERDLLKKLDFQDLLKLKSMEVGGAMTQGLKTADHAAPYAEVIDLMRRHNIRHMPVLKDNAVVGVVSLRDLVRHYMDDMELLLEEKQRMLLANLEKIQKSEEELKLANRDLMTNEKALRILIKDKEETQRRLLATQQQLVQSEKMATVGTLAAGIAHEIKNPLGIILQGIERIEKNLKAIGDEKNSPFVKIVKDATERATKVVLALLKYSRSSQVDLQEFDICQSIEDAFELVRNSEKFDRVVFKKDFPPESCLVQGDKIMIEQIFVDLLTNAVQAMPDGGEINIKVYPHTAEDISEQRDEIVVEVRDSGVGIAPEIINKIFDPFFTTKDAGEGTGLGLSTVYLIMSQHKGKITVNSVSGEGTTFTLRFPIKQQADKKETEE